jgi:hypothetical protein
MSSKQKKPKALMTEKPEWTKEDEAEWCMVQKVVQQREALFDAIEANPDCLQPLAFEESDLNDS